ncbi:taste receptor type 2 member 62-like [Elephas maximus indicus]|uniref:taste receptor type 2 member 62-like n=1 Tax=Elephas maximus indicus TaxID=99487 RepID=UPI002116707D|nr:taste receptor type 2 member 62-like [Elephas maximus indicus]
MTSPTTLFFMAVFFLESLAARLQNGFMAAVLGWEWVRGLALPAGDMIVACLLLSQLGLHATYPASGWMPCCLSSTHEDCLLLPPWFPLAQVGVSWFVLRLLLGFLTISVLTTIPSVIRNIIASHMEASQPPHTKGSWADPSRIFYRNFFLFQEMLVLSVPFLLFMASTALFMSSLCLHLWRMQDCQHGPRDPSIRVHTTALRSLGFFLVFYTSYFLSLIVAEMIMPLQLHWHWAWQVVTYTGMYLHSVILLLNSPRLRRALKNGLQGCRAIGCGVLDGGLKSGASVGLSNPM